MDPSCRYLNRQVATFVKKNYTNVTIYVHADGFWRYQFSLFRQLLAHYQHVCSILGGHLFFIFSLSTLLQ
jgi:hypothetical protein